MVIIARQYLILRDQNPRFSVKVYGGVNGYVTSLLSTTWHRTLHSRMSRPITILNLAASGNGGASVMILPPHFSHSCTTLSRYIFSVSL